MIICAFTSTVYYVAGLGAILYPGTMGLDPEFGGPAFPQAGIFSTGILLGLSGALLEAIL